MGTPSIEKYVVDCKKRNFKDSEEYCSSNNWVIASFHSDNDVNEVKVKLDCDVYIGATSDGNGNWVWIDNSPWWYYSNNDGLYGVFETKIVWRKSDDKWNDWGRGKDLKGVVCKLQGNYIEFASNAL